jgi:FKBP-type peptidyl-prolyl cis-trans isomerase SlyD
MSLPLADNRVGIVHYTLRNDKGDVLDSSSGGEPLAYLHGHRNIVPGLESALVGKTDGDQVTVAVAPADGYGEKQGEGPQRIRRNELPKDLDIHVGMPLHGEDEEGNMFTLWVTDAKGAWVWVDINHPLAGETLHFEVEVLSVRDALEVELEHGHAHGIDGQGHHHHH